MNNLNIAVLQLTSTDVPDDNQEHILKLLHAVPSEPGLDLVFLPENSLFIRIDKASKHLSFTLSDAIYAPFQEFCRSRGCHILFGSNPVTVANGIANATVWVNDKGEITSPYTKMHLFDVDVKGHKPVRESDDFVAGQSPAIIQVNGWKIGLSICYDIRFAELYSQYAKQSVDILCAPAAFLQKTGEAHWEVLQRARAIESQAYMVSAAQCGTHINANGQTRQSYGHSLVVDPWGKVLAKIEEHPGFFVCSLSKASLGKVREQIPMRDHRKLSPFV